MKYARCLAMAFLALTSVTGCDGSDRALTPTQPSRPAATPGPTSTISGEITITSISPAPGATVLVRACASGSARFCADHPQLTIDVVVDQDIPNASLTVAFDRCGFARTPVTSLTAGSRTSLTTSVVDLSDDGPLHDGVGAARYCEFSCGDRPCDREPVALRATRHASADPGVSERLYLCDAVKWWPPASPAVLRVAAGNAAVGRQDEQPIRPVTSVPRESGALESEIG